jgi:transposase
VEVLHARCAGLDVHRDTVVACCRIMSDGTNKQDVQTFGTTTKELLALSEWLTAHAVTHVAMEATGVYWKPVWHVLDGHFDLVLANASHIKNVPGRKTDVNDAMWIADLLGHGLIRASFVPETPIQNLRDLTRTRKQLVRERASHASTRSCRTPTSSSAPCSATSWARAGAPSSPRSLPARPTPRSSPRTSPRG